jgi:hypothetical protein
MDMLKFQGGLVERMDAYLRLAGYPAAPVADDGSLLRAWTGSWPPPERMTLAVGRITGLHTCFDTDNHPQISPAQMVELEQAAEMMVYRRVSASRLPDDLDNEHVFRGAVYEPET